MRDGSSQTPEPARPRLSRQGVSSTNIPRTPRRDTNSQTTRNLSRQRGVSSTDIPRTPRRDSGTAMVPRNLSRHRGVSGIDIARTPRREAESQADRFPESRTTGSQANTLPRPHFPMGGGIGTADEPPPPPSAPFERLPGGWPLTLPPEPGSGLLPAGRPDFPDLERAHDEPPGE